MSNDTTTYDVEINDHPESKTHLILNPEDRHIYSTTSYGGNTRTMDEHHVRHLRIATVNSDVDTDALIDWLVAHDGKIEALCDQYDGTEWNGNNRVGCWADYDNTVAMLVMDLSDGIDNAIAGEDIATYWDARSWCDGDWAQTLADVRNSDDLDDLAQDYVNAASINGQLLRLDDVRSVLDDAAEEIANEDDEG